MAHKIEIFPWNRNFETGLPEIDRQHQRLVELLNILVGHLAFQMDAPSIEDIIRELREYSTIHFSYEENIWHEYFKGDPWEQWHKSAHIDFVDKILQIKANEDKQFEEIIEEVVSFLTHWLALHIIESDKRMAKVVLAMPTGISLERAKELANKEMSGATRVLIDTVMSMYDNLAHRTILLTREINTRKRTEAALSLAQANLKHLKEEAELREQRALADIRNFGEVLAHHIQEAVRAQLIFTSMLKKAVCLNAPYHPEIEFAIGEVTRGAERLRSLVRDVEIHLSLSTSHWSPQACVLDDIIEKAKGRLAAKIRESGARIGYSDMPTVVIDPVRMIEVLTAILDNSITYCRNDLAPVVNVAAIVDGQMLRLTIDDNGIGVAPEFRDRAFKMFERLNSERNLHNTGIGLALVKKIVESVGGTVALEGSPLGGTRVSLAIPTGYRSTLGDASAMLADASSPPA